MMNDSGPSPSQPTPQCSLPPADQRQRLRNVVAVAANPLMKIANGVGIKFPPKHINISCNNNLL